MHGRLLLGAAASVLALAGGGAAQASERTLRIALVGTDTATVLAVVIEAPPWSTATDRPELSDVRLWVDTPRGVLNIAVTSCLAIGVASGTVTPAPESDLWRMFGGVPRPFAGGFSANWVLDGAYTKFFVTREAP